MFRSRRMCLSNEAELFALWKGVKELERLGAWGAALEGGSFVVC